MGTIQIKNLSFRFDQQTNYLFDQLNLNIDETWKLGLIGRNGRGKTTFLNLLLGKYDWHQGSIQSGVTFKYFPAPIADLNQKTISILLSISGLTETKIWRIQQEIDKLKLSNDILERPFISLSPGEQTKATLAALFVDQGSFQLIDEPTNHLDAIGRKVVADYLKSKEGFIVVSHDTDFINQVIDHVLSIDRAKIQLFNGNYDTWKSEYQRQNSYQESQNIKIKNEIKRLNQTARQIEAWAGNAENKKSKQAHSGQEKINLDKGYLGHKAAKMMKRSKNVVKRTEAEIENKQNLLRNSEEQAALSFNYQPLHQEHLLAVNKLQVQQNNKVLNLPITFDFKKGQRLALEGANGAGKSTLIKAILGQKQLIAAGNFQLSDTIKISYLPQLFQDVAGSLEDYASNYQLELSTLLNLLRKLGFDRELFSKDIKNFSIGQKRKLSLAKSLSEPANFYIWDEPLNYLDVITKQQIQDLILEIQPTMIVIDHDQSFINTICNQPAISLEKPTCKS